MLDFSNNYPGIYSYVGTLKEESVDKHVTSLLVKDVFGNRKKSLIQHN